MGHALMKMWLPTLAAALTWWASKQGYLLGHTLAELMSTAVAWTALAVATTSVHFTRNHFVAFIAVGIGWCGGLDLLHALAFKGMHLLPTDSADPATQLWVAARFTQALTLLLAPWMLRHTLPMRSLHGLFGTWTLFCAVLIYLGLFPSAYIDGQGLTPFKIYAEYLIIAMMGVSAWLLWRHRTLMHPSLMQRLMAATLIMIAAEFAFTRYVSVYGDANLIGHLLKIYAYWFVCDALVQHSLQEPFDMLSRTVSRYDAVPDPTVIASADGIILQANQAAAQWVKRAPEALVGQSVHELFHVPLEAAESCPACQRMRQTHSRFLITLGLQGLRTVECHSAPLQTEGRQAWIQVLRDVTERERLSRERESLLHQLNERVKELRGLHGVAQVLKAPDSDLPSKLQQLVDLLPGCFVLVDRIQVGIESQWGRFGAELPAQLPKRHIQAAIERNGILVGSIHAWYPDDLVSDLAIILPEEQQLIASVAAQLNEALQGMQAAERVQRLTSLYDMLSRSGREMARHQSQASILKALLGTLQQHGAFPVVFIALNDGPGTPLHLHLQHGLTTDQTSFLQETLANEHPPFTAIRERLKHKLVVSEALKRATQQDDVTGTSDTPERWLMQLNRRELTHQAVMALRCEDRLVGIACLYARGVSGVDAEQTRLLEDIANDVHIALDKAASQSRSQTAEQSAEQMSRRFEQVFQATPVPMQVTSRQSRRFLALNTAHQNWLGYSLDDLTSEDRWFELAYADHDDRATIQQLWQEQVARCQAGQTISSPELSLRCKDGSSRIARGTVTVVGDDVIVAWTDLTEIRRGEQALRDSEQRFRSMVEQTISGIYVRRDHSIIYTNPRFGEILGYAPQELIGQDIASLAAVDAAEMNRLQQRVMAFDAGEVPSASYSVPMRRKDGQIIELGLNAKRITWDDGLPATIVMAQDITERKHTEDQIAHYVQELEAAMQGTLHAVSNMVEMRDPYTAGHERRVGLIAAAIGRQMGWDEARCKNLELIGLVHDIGKISVPSEILTKPSRLSGIEMELMKGHAQAGYEILKDVPFRTPVAEIIRQHHERLNGSGYPRGLKGEEILPEARVLAVADVLESMSSHRPYRPAMGVDAALAELKQHRGTLFDADVVDAAVQLVQDHNHQLPS